MEGGGTRLSDLPGGDPIMDGGYGGSYGGSMSPMQQNPNVYNPVVPMEPVQGKATKQVRFQEEGTFSFINNPKELKASITVMIIFYIMSLNAIHIMIHRWVPNMIDGNGRITAFSMIIKAIIAGLIFFFFHNIMKII